jgi:gliding motility-associated protein GldM
MALPAEPRQKMINIMYLVLTAILALNVSAEILNAFKVVDSSLAKSNSSIDNSNKTLFESLKAKMEEPASREKATQWNDKALQVQKLADEMYKKLESYKDSLLRASGYNPEQGITNYKEDDLEAATRLFIVNGKGPQLQKELETFKKQVLAIDPAIAKEFETKLPIDLTVPPSTTGSGANTWEYNYFHMTPTVAAITILSKFENDVKNAQNQVTTFCHNQVGAVKVVFDKFQPIANASSTYLMPGQELVVQAGVGAFNSQAKPNITIGGTPIPVNDNGVAEKKFNVSGTGNQKVHVTINFVKPDGTPDKLEKDIEYTVGVPGGAAVMLDKMNVFYIGVDNPVTISSGSGWDKTNVSISGGTMSGSNGNRIVNVTAPGTAKITVSADGKTSSFDFRVKRIPDPIIKVGPSGGGKIQSVVFKNQGFVRADLENFDFAANFSVVGATIYFSNPGDRNVKQVNLTSGSLAPAAQYMQTLVPGSQVIFDNIKVVGPDKITRTIQNPPGFSLF